MVLMSAHKNFFLSFFLFYMRTLGLIYFRKQIAIIISSSNSKVWYFYICCFRWRFLTSCVPKSTLDIKSLLHEPYVVVCIVLKSVHIHGYLDCFSSVPKECFHEITLDLMKVNLEIDFYIKYKHINFNMSKVCLFTFENVHKI